MLKKNYKYVMKKRQIRKFWFSLFLVVRIGRDESTSFELEEKPRLNQRYMSLSLQ